MMLVKTAAGSRAWLLHEDGQMTRVERDATKGKVPWSFLWLFETKSLARPRDPAMVDRMTSVFPRPMSSARIPPFASLGSIDFAPVMLCWKL